MFLYVIPNSDVGLTSAGIVSLAKNISKLENLEILEINLWWNDIRDDGVIALTKHIGMLPKIATLELDLV